MCLPAAKAGLQALTTIGPASPARLASVTKHLHLRQIGPGLQLEGAYKLQRLTVVAELKTHLVSGASVSARARVAVLAKGL